MGKRVVNGIKEGLSVFVLSVIVAIILNFLKLDIGYSRFWTYLSNLGIINFFDEKPLNGLVILGFFIRFNCFCFSFIFS